MGSQSTKPRSVPTPEEAAKELLELLSDYKNFSMGPVVAALQEQREALPVGVRELVEQQAEDEALWTICTSASEAYMQRELRRLHAALESDPMMAFL